MASFLTIFANEDEDEVSNNARATLRVFEEEPNLCLADSLTSRRKLSRRKICCPYTKRVIHFCLASAASADASILDEGKGGRNLDAAARTIINDRGARFSGAVVLVASETIEALSDEINRANA